MSVQLASTVMGGAVTLLPVHVGIVFAEHATLSYSCDSWVCKAHHPQIQAVSSSKPDFIHACMDNYKVHMVQATYVFSHVLQ